MSSELNDRPTKDAVIIHAPALKAHLRHFGIRDNGDEVFARLSLLSDFAGDFEEEEEEEEEDPETIALLHSQFPRGLESRSILRYECMFAGMGGCGAADVGVLYCPASGIEIACWLDLENADGGVLASVGSLKEMHVSQEFVAHFLKGDFGDGMRVVNEAISLIENYATEVITRKSLKELWRQTAEEGRQDVQLALQLFDQFYRQRRRRHPLMGV